MLNLDPGEYNVSASSNQFPGENDSTTTNVDRDQVTVDLSLDTIVLGPGDSDETPSTGQKKGCAAAFVRSTQPLEWNDLLLIAGLFSTLWGAAAFRSRRLRAGSRVSPEQR